MSDLLIKCDLCNGTKKMVGMGHLEQPCSRCNATGMMPKQSDDASANSKDDSNVQLKEDLGIISDAYSQLQNEATEKDKRIKELETQLAKQKMITPASNKKTKSK